MRKQTRTNREQLYRIAARAKRRRKLSNFIHSDLIVGLTELLTCLWIIGLFWLLLVAAGSW